MLADFIKMYLVDFERGFSEEIYHCEFSKSEGITLPNGFEIQDDICFIPLFIVAVNKSEKAIIVYDGELTVSIYYEEVYVDAALSFHKKYFQDRFERFCLKRFCDSVKGLELMEILDAITMEIHKVDGIKGKDIQKLLYREELNILLKLFVGTPLPKENLRSGFIDEANELLKKLSQNLVALKDFK